MSKKGFTLIELIAVVVIMAIIALIATPNIVRMMDKGKKSDYVADANEFISKATYMYKQEKYHKDDTKVFGDDGKIYLKDIEGLKEEDKIDPYGYKYLLNESFIKFEEPTSATLGERKVSITLISCPEGITDQSKCYKIENVEKSLLDEDDVKNPQY